MRTFFIQTLLSFLFFVLLSFQKTIAQTGQIVPYTIKSSSLAPDHYYPMAGFNSEEYKEFSYIRTGSSSFMNMRLLFPEDYDSSTEDGKQYPLILMLHGAGESAVTNWGTGGDYPSGDPRNYNNDHQLLYGGKEHLDASRHRPDSDPRHWPGFVLFPQNLRNGSWDTDGNDKVIEIIEILIDSLKVDPLRIYVWGLSNGAKGTWDISNRRPDLFAAALPMSGIGSHDPAKLAHMPIWIFQGELDTNPNPNASTDAIKLLRNHGGTPRYTLYENTGHGTWYNAYKEPDFYTWMLQYSELSIHVYFGKNEICPEDIDQNGNISPIKLGISPGHAAYQWSYNGTEASDLIPNANTSDITVDKLGKYYVRIKTQGSNEWTAWSEPVEIKAKETFLKPTIAVSGSTFFPTLDIPQVKNVTLSASEGYTNYKWNYGNNGQTQTLYDNGTGYRIVQVNDAYGCRSSWSDTVYVSSRTNDNLLTPPSSLTLQPVSETGMNLFWQDNSPTNRGFEIYRSKDGGNTYSFVAKTEANAEYYADRGLEPGTAYQYKVRAVEMRMAGETITVRGMSKPTESAVVATYDDTEAPSRPSDLVATANLDLRSITLNWTPATDNVGVKEYIIYEVQAGNTLNTIGTTAETNFIVEGLQEQERYTYVIKAVDASNNQSEVSNQASAITAICGLRYTLYVTDGNQPYGSVNDFLSSQIVAKGVTDNFDIGIRTIYPAFNGTTSDDHFGFEFEGVIQIDQPGKYGFKLKSDDGSVLWIDDVEIINHDGAHGATEKSGNVNLTSGRHIIKVRYFEIGSGNELSLKYSGPGISGEPLIPNEVLCINEYDLPEPPASPTNLKAIAASMTQINLEWNYNNSGSEYGFEVFRSESAQGPFAIVHTAGINERTYQDVGLAPNTTYYYRIRTIGETGQSAYATKEDGVNYTYYEYTGNWQHLPDFTNISITPSLTGKINNFDISPRLRNDYFAFVFEGQIAIGEAGDYIFYTKSDDGSKLYIDDVEVVNHDGLHGATEKSGAIELSSGVHSIRVAYYEQTGAGEMLEVRYEGASISKQLIPDMALNFISATTSEDNEPPVMSQDLTVVSSANHNALLSWTAATDNVAVVGYNIYKLKENNERVLLGHSDESGNAVEQIFETPSTFDNKALAGVALLNEPAQPTIYFDLKGLTSGTEYDIVVTAVDGSNLESNPSNTASFTTGGESPLPIELISFSGKAGNGMVKLTWTTGSEKNNDFFTIERAVNDKFFKEIGTLEGAGTSVSEKSYAYTDDFPPSGTLFYRLKQTDFNGDFEYSNIISIKYPNASDKNLLLHNLVLYPNPTSSENINLKLEGEYPKGNASLRIIDLLGNTLFNYHFETDSLAKGLKIHTNRKITPGIYIVIIEHADKVNKVKLIIEE